MTRRDITHRTIAAAMVVVAAASAWWRLFGAAPTLFRIIPAAIMVAVAFRIGTAGGKRIARGLGALVALAATFASALLFAAVTMPDTDGSITPTAVIDGTINGLGTLLRSPVPAPVNSQTISAAIIFTGYAMVVACLVACTAAPGLMVLPAFALFLGATALSQGSLHSPMTSGLAFTIACLGAWAMVPTGSKSGQITDGVEFAEPIKGPTTGRTIQATLITLIVCGLALGGSVLADASGIGEIRPPFDPHQHDNLSPNTKLRPIEQINNWQTVERHDNDVLMTVTGNNLVKAMWWSIQERYNGQTWQAVRTYSDAKNGQVPYTGPDAKYTATVDYNVSTTTNFQGPWMPTQLRATKIVGQQARYDELGNIILASDDATNITYTATSRILALKSLAPLESANAAKSPRNSITKELPADYPMDLRVFASDVMGTGADGYTRLQRLADTLSSSPYRERTTEPQVSPFTLQSIAELVLENHKGTQAQFATAFALMARSQGFESRLVAGFSLPDAAGGRVSTEQAIVWPEVKLKNVGWVPFAPGPQDISRGVPVPVPYHAKPTPKPKPTPTPKPTVKPTPKPTHKPDHTNSGGGIPTFVWLLGGLAVLAGLWLAWVASRRRALRKRCESGREYPSAAGAWVWDRSARAHLKAPVPTSPHQAATDTTDASTPELTELAMISEYGFYSPDTVDQSGTARAWQLADTDIAALKRQGGFAANLRWWWLPLRALRNEPTPEFEPISDADKPDTPTTDAADNESFVNR